MAAWDGLGNQSLGGEQLYRTTHFVYSFIFIIIFSSIIVLSICHYLNPPGFLFSQFSSPIPLGGQGPSEQLRGPSCPLG